MERRYKNTQTHTLTMKLPTITKKTLDAKFVLCHWLDINSDASWMSLEKAETSTPTICISTGWLIKQDKNVHILCGDINFEDDGTLGDVGNVTVIPTINVIKKKVLKI